MDCPNCHHVLVKQPSLAINYKLVFCYGMTKEGKLCGLEGILHLDTEQLTIKKLANENKDPTTSKRKQKKETGWKTLETRIEK